MSDLIRRQDAIDVLEILADKMSDEGQTVMTQAVAVLKDLRSAEPERIAKVERCSFGETLTYDFDGQCECGKWVDSLWGYCPSCGAKLEWE